MRILYLNPTGQLGGAEASLLEILASVRFAEPSWPLHLVLGGDGPLASRAAALGVATDVLPFPAALARVGEWGTTNLRRGGWQLAAQMAASASAVRSYLGRLDAAIRAFEPDVVHTNGLKMHVLGAWAHPRSPLVWHLHDYLGPRPMTARLLRWNSARCAMLVANSASVASDARTALADSVEIVAVANGVDLNRFTASGDRLDLDALAGLPASPPDAIRIGLVATFARWKGHVTFLEAIARVPRALPLRAYVIGDAVYDTRASQYSRGELTAIAERLEVTDRVGFTGFVTRPEAALRALDIVVHASTRPEPFGLVIAEAMACGRPVIVSADGGAAELVDAGMDALVHTPGDVQGLADCLVRLMTDAVLRRQIGGAARATAERRFNRARLAGELLPIYRAAARAA